MHLHLFPAKLGNDTVSLYLAHQNSWTPSMSTDQKDIPVENKNDRKTSIEEPSVGDVNDVVLDPKKEKKLLMKLDIAFVPIIMVTYLSCFLDRTNIGMLCILP